MELSTQCHNWGIVLFTALSFSSVATGQLKTCSPNPCRNGGTCFLRNLNNYTCQCPLDFSGQNCTQLSFKASIGIFDVERYLLGLLGHRKEPDMTNFNAKSLGSTISFSPFIPAPDIQNSFKWTFNDTVIEPGQNFQFYISETGKLTIFQGSLSNEGVYQMLVSNEFGALLGTKIRLKFAVTGAFRSPNTSINLTMVEGEQFLLPCPPRMYSHPRSTYEWHTAGGELISNSSLFGPRVLTEPNGDLLFSSVQARDSLFSPARCTARGLFSERVEGPPVYFNIDSTATQSPNSTLRFHTQPQGVYSALIGDQLYLNCTAGGRSGTSGGRLVPEILWYKNDTLIADSGDFFQHQVYNRTLRLGSIHPEIHNGTYRCEAVSDLQRQIATFHIKVLYNVTALYNNASDLYELRAAEHGASVKLLCNTTGHPITSRTWYHNGVELRHSANFVNRSWSVDSNGTLEIRQLLLNDSGFYQCFAKNELSEGDRKTYLVVTGAPLPPTNVQLTNCTNHTTNITWDLRTPLDIAPTGFVIEWRARRRLSLESLPSWALFSKLVEISAGPVRSYVAMNLKAWIEIEFRIRAKNDLGTGFPGASIKCLTGTKRPSLFPKDLRAVPSRSEDGTIYITWTPLDQFDWSGNRCAYRIFYRQNAPSSPWNNVTVLNCRETVHNIRGLRPNSEFEIAIRAENIEGPGPSSPSIRTLSGQTRPPPPVNVTVVRVNSSSVELEWSAPDVSPPKTVDGYWILAAVGSLFRDVREASPEPVHPESRRKRSANLPQVDRQFSNGTIGVHVNTSLRGVVTGLKPWTTYLVVLTAYNNAGLGDPRLLNIRTLDSKDSYFLLSLRITSEAFTEDLRDQSSSRYKRLERNLTHEVSLLYKKHIWFKRAFLLAFRPGSVQADMQLEVASPNVSVVINVVSAMDNLGNFSLDRNETKMKIEQGIQSVTVTASSLRVNVSDKIVIFCNVTGGPDDLNIKWYMADKVIGLTRRTKVETSFRQSNLTIRDVIPEDEGSYSCIASKGIQSKESTLFIEVIPVLVMEPQTVSRSVGDHATFTCTVVSGFRTGASVLIVELTERGIEVRQQGSNLTVRDNVQILQGEGSLKRRFVCELWAQQTLLSKSAEVELIIAPPDVPKCPAEVMKGVSWAASVRGVTDIQPCPPGASGSASRECGGDARWRNPSFIGCRSSQFIDLEDEIEATTEGFQSNTTAGEVLSQLVSATKLIVNNSKRPAEIYGGDLLIAVNILVAFAEYNNVSGGNVSSEENVNNHAQVLSNLLDSTNTITWQNLEEAGQGISRTLVRTVDDYGLGVATTLNGPNKSITVETKNLLVNIKRVTPASPVRNKGLNVSYQQSSIYLPPETFRTKNASVVSVIYLTLNDVLPLAKKNRGDKPISPNTTIVSSSVFPIPSRKFNTPVKIILQNKRVNGTTPKAKCVFWRPGESAIWKTSGCELVPSESDADMTTCQCDHLTIFASLMDPYESTIDEADQKALEIISITGCTISLIGVLVTIAVTLFFWRVVKSPRAKVLLNLCAAIALSCIFVIFEGSARDSKVGCSVVAAFLHYFLLALFSWMLCEGVLLYILLVKVFGGGAQEKVKYFYIFGWGFPAIIVAISLAATQTVGYGSAQACWLDVSSGLIWAFIAPAITIILVNIVVFALVIRQMMGTRNVQNKTQVEKVKAGVKASAVILPLLGITWLFGLLAFNSATIAFKYIFAIANSLQGLMIFIFHCLLNKQIKDAINRLRDKSSSGVVSSTPRSKPSPKPQARFVVKQEEKAPKKRSNRAQNYNLPESASEVLEDSIGVEHDKFELEFVEFTKLTREIKVANACSVPEEELLDGALPSCSSQESPAQPTTAKRTEFNDTVKNDEDFEIKMKNRRGKVDTVQGAAEAFAAGKNKVHRLTSLTNHSPWDVIRKNVHRRTYKVTRLGKEEQDKTREERVEQVDNQRYV